MSPCDPDPLRAAINAKLAQVAASSAIPPSWHQRWLDLGPESSEEEVLAVYQAVRDAASVPAEVGLYLVAWQIDVLTLRCAEDAFQELEGRLEAIRRAHGLAEGASWPTGERPAEYETVQQQLHDAWEALYANKLEEFGEREMARLFRADREQFEQLSEAGRQFFFPASEEDEAAAWQDRLLETLVGCVEADSAMGPWGLRYREEEGFWEVWIYPTPVELIGGADDGAVVVPGYRLDLEALRLAFTSVAAFGWDALGLNNPDGPHVYVEGVFQGREVWLHVLAQAPEGEEPGLKFDTTK